MACCHFNLADEPDDIMAKYSLYFLFDWSWTITFCYSYEVLFTWVFETPALIKLWPCILPSATAIDRDDSYHKEPKFFQRRNFYLRYSIIYSIIPPLIRLFFNILFLNRLESHPSFCGTSKLLFYYCSIWIFAEQASSTCQLSALIFTTCLDPFESDSDTVLTDIKYVIVYWIFVQLCRTHTAFTSNHFNPISGYYCSDNSDNSYGYCILVYTMYMPWVIMLNDGLKSLYEGVYYCEWAIEWPYTRAYNSQSWPTQS